MSSTVKRKYMVVYVAEFQKECAETQMEHLQCHSRDIGIDFFKKRETTDVF